MPLPNFIALRKFLGTNYDELHATLLVKGFIRDIDQSSGVLDQILFRGKFTCSEVLSSHRFPVKVQYLAIAAAVEEMVAKGMALHLNVLHVQNVNPNVLYWRHINESLFSRRTH
ncbi:hypothetical protein CPT_Morttis_029 [Acinetobacter phage Morttis]|nr:hypothetical protein CPT_Morttis_029 [Acinetobacter phage Morttis]